MRDRGRAGQRQPRHHGENRGEGHRRQEAQHQVAADRVRQVHGGHVAAAKQLAGQVAALEILRVGADDGDRRQSHDGDHGEKEADAEGGDEHALAGFLGVGHGEEAHQDVGQTGGAEHQAERQRDCRDRIGQESARRHQRHAFLGILDRLGRQRLEAEAELGKGQQHHQRAAAEQQAGLDDLHPGGGDHAAESDVDHHQHADDDHRHPVLHAEQQLDELARAHHLRDQIEHHHGQRADGRHGADPPLIQPVGGDVGEGEFAQVAQPFCHDEHDERPPDVEADAVNVAIKTLEIGHAGEAEQGGRRHVVAGDGQAVLRPGDAAAGGIVVAGRLGALGRPIGDAQGHHHEDEEHHDGVDVQRLFLGLAHVRGGHGQAHPAHG